MIQKLLARKLASLVDLFAVVEIIVLRVMQVYSLFGKEGVNKITVTFLLTCYIWFINRKLMRMTEVKLRSIYHPIIYLKICYRLN